MKTYLVIVMEDLNFECAELTNQLAYDSVYTQALGSNVVATNSDLLASIKSY